MEKLRTDGFNELPLQQKRNFLRIAFEVIHEPMFILLLASGLIYFFPGDTSEGLILMSFVAFIIGITVYQEHKTGRALEALRNRSSPRTLVIRGGDFGKKAHPPELGTGPGVPAVT